MKIFEIENFLLEDRSDYIKQNAKQVDKITAAAEREKKDGTYSGTTDINSILNKLKTADPLNGENIVWIARMYGDQQFRLEDLNRLKDNLRLFFKNKAKIQNKDLNSYGNLQQLYSVIEPFKVPEDPEQEEFLSGIDGAGSAVGALESLVKVPNTKVLINTPTFVVTIPENLKASKQLCTIGGNTEWCTQHTDEYNKYSGQGPLYVLAAIKGGKVKKWQFHVESNQYMDRNDFKISKADINFLSSIPAYTQFLNYLIKKHYGKYLAV